MARYVDWRAAPAAPREPVRQLVGAESAEAPANVFADTASMLRSLVKLHGAPPKGSDRSGSLGRNGRSPADGAYAPATNPRGLACHAFCTGAQGCSVLLTEHRTPNTEYRILPLTRTHYEPTRFERAGSRATHRAWQTAGRSFFRSCMYARSTAQQDRQWQGPGGTRARASAFRAEDARIAGRQGQASSTTTAVP